MWYFGHMQGMVESEGRLDGLFDWSGSLHSQGRRDQTPEMLDFNREDRHDR